MSWLPSVAGLVTSNDILRDPRFPLHQLETVAPKLRWIHITGAGIEPLLPLRWLPQQVVLTNNSGVHVEKIRELAAMMLLMLNARIPAIMTNQRNAKWEQIFTSTIRGRTVLIVGVGEMGGAIAAAARGLGLRVLGVRREGAPHEAVDQMYRSDQLDSTLPLADFLVLAAPLTKANDRSDRPQTPSNAQARRRGPQCCAGGVGRSPGSHCRAAGRNGLERHYRCARPRASAARFIPLACAQSLPDAARLIRRRRSLSSEDIGSGVRKHPAALGGAAASQHG